MSLFDLLRGVTRGTAESVQTERQRRRDLEDRELAMRVKQLEDLAHSPNFNSEHYAQLQSELAQLSGAAGGPRKLKSGAAGFMGAHEDLPLSQILAAVTHGDASRPVNGGSAAETLLHPSVYSAFGGDGPGPGGQPPMGSPAPRSAPASVTGGLPTPPGAPAGAGVVPARASTSPAPAPAPLSPKPPAQLPQPPGTSDLVTAGNDMAQETTQPVPAMRSGPPPVPFPDAEHVSSPFLSDEQVGKRAGNKAFRSQYGTHMGDIEGRVAAGAASGVPMTPEDKAHLAYNRPYGTQASEWVEDPDDSTREIELQRNTTSGKLTPTGNSRINTRAYTAGGRSVVNTIGAHGTTSTTTRTPVASGSTPPSTATPKPGKPQPKPGSQPRLNPPPRGGAPTAGDDVERYAQMLIGNKIAPSQIPNPARTSFKKSVLDRAMALGYNAQGGEANFKFGSSPATQNTVRFIKNIEKTLPILERSSANLQRSGLRMFNAADLAVRRQTGDKDVVAFDTNRLILADEIAKILQGGGTGNSTSDMKLKQSQDLLRGDMTHEQFRTAIASVKELTTARKESLTNGTFMEQGPPTGDAAGTPNEGDTRPIPDGSGTAVYRGGRWIRQ